MKRFYNFFLFIAAFFLTNFSYCTQVAGESGSAELNTSTINMQIAEASIPQEGIYDLMLDSVAGPLTYYNQTDSRWRDFLYGGKDPMSIYGCGPTVMAMLITSLTGNQVLPPDVAAWAVANNCWCPGEGSYHKLIKTGASAYGLTATSLRNYTVEGIRETLDSGNMIVALMKRGHFTQQGHFIILTRMTSDGLVYIADSNTYTNSIVGWDPEIIIKELNYNSGNGGPLWIIGLPE